MDSNFDKETWDWNGEDYGLENTCTFADISQELWNYVPPNEDHPSYMFDCEATPVKACGDFFAYNFNNSESNNSQKEPEECRETSFHVKRRRMLQFNTHDEDHDSLSNDHMPSYLKINGKEGINENVLPEVSQQVSEASGNVAASNYEDLESAEEWLADCFNDAEMQLCPDDLNFSWADDVHIDVADDTVELCDVPTTNEQIVAQEYVPQTPRIVSKGRKSFIPTTPTKLSSSVAYPFAFIKPSGVHGDVTLKEINQRISGKPSKFKQSSEDPLGYPKSPFSGKPVVGKTKIHTLGKGSITIMKTKG